MAVRIGERCAPVTLLCRRETLWGGVTLWHSVTLLTVKLLGITVLAVALLAVCPRFIISKRCRTGSHKRQSGDSGRNRRGPG